MGHAKLPQNYNNKKLSLHSFVLKKNKIPHTFEYRIGTRDMPKGSVGAPRHWVNWHPHKDHVKNSPNCFKRAL
jgi:hypothetical protein